MTVMRVDDGIRRQSADEVDRDAGIESRAPWHRLRRYARLRQALGEKGTAARHHGHVEAGDLGEPARKE